MIGSETINSVILTVPAYSTGSTRWPHLTHTQMGPTLPLPCVFLLVVSTQGLTLNTSLHYGAEDQPEKKNITADSDLYTAEPGLPSWVGSGWFFNFILRDFYFVRFSLFAVFTLVLWAVGVLSSTCPYL